MALIPDRSTLESLRRADLQKLCKVGTDHGLKANMKSEQLIDLLLDTAQANPSMRATRRSASVRIISEGSTGPDTRGRVGSMIIHDVPEDEGEGGEHGPVAESSTAANGGPSQSQPTGPSPPSGPATRTRKAKETLYKLGVGRPKALGGTGARKVSRGPPSGFGARGKRVKASVSIQPSHEAIREEEEDGAPHTQVDEPMLEAGPSGTTHDSTPSLPTPTTQQPHDSAAHLQTMIAEAVDPLRTELEKLRSELQRWSSLHGDVDALKTTVTQLTSEVAALRLQSGQVGEMQQQMKSLQEEIAAMRAGHTDKNNHMRAESSGKATEHSASHTAIETPSIRNTSPSPPKTALGKRHRDSPDTNASDVIDAAQASALSEEELAKKVLRPERKRAKLAERETGGGLPHTPGTIVPDNEPVEEDEEMPDRPPVPRPASFTIFSGPEEPPDNGPPTTRLSDVFGHTAVTPPNGVSTATASASENQPPSSGGPFSFSTSIFQLATSTPTGTLGVPQDPGFSTFPSIIPAPQAPTSPTPAGPTSRLSVAPGTRPPRPPSAASHPTGGRQGSQPPAGSSHSADATTSTPGLPTVAESSAQAQTPAQRINPAHMGLGMSMGLPGFVPLPIAPETPAPPMKRTMYGTELDGDTRFGDFGVEGVATGFWTGTAPRY
ncbi:hypothetical protein EIP86_000867 [Pleurotus ostreatoroseus]|nr:hypothetical protein EIP86_000867 [Pleurotus ostreatoroseus]